MSEQPQFSSQKHPAQDVASSSMDQWRQKAMSESYLQDYVDMDCESSGIFGNLDVEAAKQFIKQTQS
jgi:hypothetical protein